MLAPITIDGRISGFLGIPAGPGKKPVLIHLHERYGIVEHTTDLGEKFAAAGFITVVPDFFSRFTGDRRALARGDDRCELSDEEVLRDFDAVLAYVNTIPEADTAKIAMSGVCQTGRQPILAAAKRKALSAAVVLYGAVYDADWKPHPLRPEPIDRLMEEISCPLTAVFGELDNLIHRDNILRMVQTLCKAKRSFDIRLYPDAPHGFLNDTMPGRFRPVAAQPAWTQIISFLNSVFAGEWARDRAIWRFTADSAVDYDFAKMKRWE